MSKVKKTKKKTHKGMKKVFNIRKGGTITIGMAGSRHNTGKKPSKINRKKRKGSHLSKSDFNRVKKVI